MATKMKKTPSMLTVYIAVLIVLLALSILSKTLTPPAMPTHVNQAPPPQAMHQGNHKTTELSFMPDSTTATPITKRVGDTVSLDIMINPGQNLVSFAKMEILYDPTKLTPIQKNGFQVDGALPTIMDGPTYTSGKIIVTMSIGADPTKAVEKPSKVATLMFKSLAKTDTGSPSVITFGSATNILSLAAEDNASDNVLSTTVPVSIAINE
jgi:hypothetical protein